MVKQWRIAVSRDVDLLNGGGYTDGRELYYNTEQDARVAVQFLRENGWRLDNDPVQVVPPSSIGGGRHEFTDSDAVRTATESSYVQWTEILKTSIPDSDEWHQANMQLMAAERSIAEAYGFDVVDRLHQKYLGDYSSKLASGGQDRSSSDEEDWEL